MKSVFDLIDTFQSRIKDMERQKKEGIVCKEDKKQSLESFLSRYCLLFLSAASSTNYLTNYYYQKNTHVTISGILKYRFLSIYNVKQIQRCSQSWM